jgi:hypothetical protein
MGNKRQEAKNQPLAFIFAGLSIAQDSAIEI